MATHDVDATLLIKRVAEELKKDANIKPAAWAPFVKTGMSRERAPVQLDWWHVRAASILRKIFMLGPIGTHKLQTLYGGRKNEGMAPEHFYPGAGNNIRKILQQLEKAGLAKQTAKGVHKGRIVTPKGHAMLENTASAIMKEQGIVIKSVPKEAPKAEPKVETAEAPAEKAKKPRAPKKKKEEAPVAQ
jgi:small subunit ribosomal protein S19e